MPLDLRDLRGNRNRRRPKWVTRCLAGVIIIAGVLSGWSVWPRHSTAPTAATPSGALTERAADREIVQEAADGAVIAGLSFEAFVVQEIATRGCLTMTLHVALADHRFSSVPEQFGNGSDPSVNLYWGALFGVDTYFANAGGWKRVRANIPEDPRILKRALFHRRAELTPQWQSRGVSEPFDVYVLANAWAGDHAWDALRQPLRDALSDAPMKSNVDGRTLVFGSGSVMTGYIGLNSLLENYENPFIDLPEHRSPERHQMGVFYICPQSAVVLHADVIQHGLYSVVFTRDAIVPEAYIADGVLQALIAGDLDSGFVEGAARAYATYQKTVSMDRAREVFYR